MENKNDKSNVFNQTISMPIIWSLIFPLIFFDIWAEIYHRTCFVLYRLPYVKRSKYIKIDRHKLKYLNFREKLGCAYCGYANGLTQYWVEIAAKTETYWCGIQHKKSKNFKSPSHHKNFATYNNKKEYNDKYNKK